MPESPWVPKEPPSKPIPLLRMPTTRCQERPRGARSRVKVAGSIKAKGKGKGSISRAECSPRQEPARVAKTVGSRRTHQTIRDDGRALANNGPVPR
eukprot:4518100-Pyramimonas_sp.AAC.1